MLVDSGRVPRPAQGYQIPTMSNLMTFHKILPGCEEGNRAAWIGISRAARAGELV